MSTRPRYKIVVKTYEGRTLTFKVYDFKLNSGFLEFTDLKNNKSKWFPISNCEISEISENDN